MSDNITPTNTPSATTTPSPLPASGKDSGITLIRNAPVASAPPAATPPADAKTITLRAVVVEDKSLPPNQTRLRTEKGDIIVRSDTRLPPDTEVMVDLQRQKAQLVATVRVAQRSADMQPPAPQQPPAATPPQTPPPQAVQAGDKLIALILSGSVPPPPALPAAPPPLTNDQAALIRQTALQLLASGGAAKAAVPLSVLTGLTASADPAAFIKTLPPEQQTALRLLLPASVQTPSTAPQAPLAQTPTTPPAPAPAPVPAATTPQQATPATPPTAQPPAPLAEPQDAGLLTLLKAMTSARLTEQALQTPQTAQGSSNALTSLVKSMLPLIQGLQSQGMTQPLATPAPQTGTLFGAQQPSGAELRIITITSPTTGSASTPATQPPLPQGHIEGTIIGQTRDGMAVIKTPVADFVLSTRISLPVGTTLTLQATPLTLSDLAAKLSANPAALSTLLSSFDPLSGDSWPALDEAMSLLAQARPEVAARMASTVPSPGPKMVPTTLFFLAALRLGIAENWLGAQTLQALRDSGGRSTADKLTGDFGRIARQSGEALPGEWRGISMPLMYDSQLSQLQMFVRKHKDEDTDGTTGGKTTRFIVNLNLSRLGGMQLDGLMHEALPAKGIDKRLDMVIRTNTRLSPGIMQDLQSAYAAGLKDSKMTGSLEFQANKKGWVDIDHRTADSRSV